MNSTEPALVIQGSKSKSLPAVVFGFFFFTAVAWFFFHLGQQGATWGYAVAGALVCAYFYIVWIFLFLDYSLILTESGFKNIPARGKALEIPWNHIDRIHAYYNSYAQTELLPDGVGIVLKAEFRQKPLLSTQKYDHVIMGPFKGIFIQELVGEMNAWLSRS